VVSRKFWSAAWVACCAGVLTVGCGGDKSPGPNPPVGTGTFTPGIFSEKTTISLTGTDPLCRAIPATIDTQIDTLCDVDQIAELLGLPVDSLIVTGSDVRASGPQVLDVEGCRVTMHGRGTGKFYSERLDLLMTASITGLSAGTACDPLRGMPCQFQIHIEATRTGPPPAGRCTTAAAPGPADILGVSWADLKPRER
jgi:hypothetical protein